MGAGYRSLVVAILVASTIASAGCGANGHHPAPAFTSESTGTLLGEIDRELAAMRVTRYQHDTRVDEAAGSFKYDCSGLLDYALGRVLPAAVSVVPTSTSSRPLAADIEQYLHRGLAGSVDGWQAVARVEELRPGDVVAWLATEDSNTGDTGHVMVVHATPARNPERHGEWLIQVADSTLSPHAHDSRRPTDTGLGTGTIGLVDDEHGAPTAFYWRGAISVRAESTEISLGRLDRTRRSH